MEDVTAQTLFDKLYHASEEFLKDLKKPFVQNKIKRQMSSAHDDAALKVVEAEEKIEEIRQNLKDYDINAILSHRLTIDDCKKLQEGIVKEYKELFNEEMK